MKKTWLDTVGRAIIEELQADVVTLKSDVATLQTNVDSLILEIQHDSELFPENTDRKVELTAGTPANTWSAWAEIQDDDTPPVTFSSKIICIVHLSGLLIEDLSNKDKRYELQIAYGDAKVHITTHRFLTGEVVKKLAAIQFIRVRAAHIPTGEKVYYRMRCETAGATCEISLRYHCHP